MAIYNKSKRGFPCSGNILFRADQGVRSERIRGLDSGGSGVAIRAYREVRFGRIEGLDSGVSDMPTRASGTYPLALLKGLHCLESILDATLVGTFS